MRFKSILLKLIAATLCFTFSVTSTIAYGDSSVIVESFKHHSWHVTPAFPGNKLAGLLDFARQAGLVAASGRAELRHEEALERDAVETAEPRAQVKEKVPEPRERLLKRFEELQAAGQATEIQLAQFLIDFEKDEVFEALSILQAKQILDWAKKQSDREFKERGLANSIKEQLKKLDARYQSVAQQIVRPIAEAVRVQTEQAGQSQPIQDSFHEESTPVLADSAPDIQLPVPGEDEQIDQVRKQKERDESLDRSIRRYEAVHGPVMAETKLRILVQRFLHKGYAIALSWHEVFALRQSRRYRYVYEAIESQLEKEIANITQSLHLAGGKQDEMMLRTALSTLALSLHTVVRVVKQADGSAAFEVAGFVKKPLEIEQRFYPHNGKQILPAIRLRYVDPATFATKQNQKPRFHAGRGLLTNPNLKDIKDSAFPIADDQRVMSLFEAARTFGPLEWVTDEHAKDVYAAENSKDEAVVQQVPVTRVKPETVEETQDPDADTRWIEDLRASLYDYHPVVESALAKKAWDIDPREAFHIADQLRAIDGKELSDDIDWIRLISKIEFLQGGKNAMGERVLKTPTPFVYKIMEKIGMVVGMGAVNALPLFLIDDFTGLFGGTGSIGHLVYFVSSSIVATAMAMMISKSLFYSGKEYSMNAEGFIRWLVDQKTLEPEIAKDWIKRVEARQVSQQETKQPLPELLKKDDQTGDLGLFRRFFMGSIRGLKHEDQKALISDLAPVWDDPTFQNAWQKIKQKDLSSIRASDEGKPVFMTQNGRDPLPEWLAEAVLGLKGKRAFGLFYLPAFLTAFFLSGYSLLLPMTHFSFATSLSKKKRQSLLKFLRKEYFYDGETLPVTAPALIRWLVRQHVLSWEDGYRLTQKINGTISRDIDAAKRNQVTDRANIEQEEMRELQNLEAERKGLVRQSQIIEAYEFQYYVKVRYTDAQHSEYRPAEAEGIIASIANDYVYIQPFSAFRKYYPNVYSFAVPIREIQSFDIIHNPDFEERAARSELRHGPEDFIENEEAQMVRELVDAFYKESVHPFAHEIDKGKIRIEDQILKEAAQAGLFGLAIPEEFGGSGLSPILKIIADIIGWYINPSVALSIGVHNSVVKGPIQDYGTEEQKKKYLTKLASGELIGGYALTELEAGSQALSKRFPLNTTAEPVEIDGKKFYKLNGVKRFITNARFAGVFVTFAMVGDKRMVFIIDRNLEGVSVGEDEQKTGLKGSSTADLILENVLVPAENMIPEDGITIGMSTMSQGRLSIAASALGGSMRIFDDTLEYSKLRKQFGGPIWQFGGVKQTLAVMAADVYAQESVVYAVASLLTEGKVNAAFESAVAKVFVTEKFNHIAQKGIKAHGGAGFISDTPTARISQDAIVTEIFEGMNDVLYSNVIAALYLKKLMTEGSQILNISDYGPFYREIQKLPSLIEQTGKVILGKYQALTPENQDEYMAFGKMVSEYYAILAAVRRTRKITHETDPVDPKLKHLLDITRLVVARGAKRIRDEASHFVRPDVFGVSSDRRTYFELTRRIGEYLVANPPKRIVEFSAPSESQSRSELRKISAIHKLPAPVSLPLAKNPNPYRSELRAKGKTSQDKKAKRRKGGFAGRVARISKLTKQLDTPNATQISETLRQLIEEMKSAKPLFEKMSRNWDLPKQVSRDVVSYFHRSAINDSNIPLLFELHKLLLGSMTARLADTLKHSRKKKERMLILKLIVYGINRSEEIKESVRGNTRLQEVLADLQQSSSTFPEEKELVQHIVAGQVNSPGNHSEFLVSSLLQLSLQFSDSAQSVSQTLSQIIDFAENNSQYLTSHFRGLSLNERIARVISSYLQKSTFSDVHIETLNELHVLIGEPMTLSLIQSLPVLDHNARLLVLKLFDIGIQRSPRVAKSIIDAQEEFNERVDDFSDQDELALIDNIRQTFRRSELRAAQAPRDSTEHWSGSFEWSGFTESQREILELVFSLINANDGSKIGPEDIQFDPQPWRVPILKVIGKRLLWYGLGFAASGLVFYILDRFIPVILGFTKQSSLLAVLFIGTLYVISVVGLILIPLAAFFDIGSKLLGRLTEWDSFYAYLEGPESTIYLPSSIDDRDFYDRAIRSINGLLRLRNSRPVQFPETLAEARRLHRFSVDQTMPENEAGSTRRRSELRINNDVHLWKSKVALTLESPLGKPDSERRYVYEIAGRKFVVFNEIAENHTVENHAIEITPAGNIDLQDEDPFLDLMIAELLPDVFRATFTNMKRRLPNDDRYAISFPELEQGKSGRLESEVTVAFGLNREPTSVSFGGKVWYEIPERGSSKHIINQKTGQLVDDASVSMSAIPALVSLVKILHNESRSEVEYWIAQLYQSVINFVLQVRGFSGSILEDNLLFELLLHNLFLGRVGEDQLPLAKNPDPSRSELRAKPVKLVKLAEAVHFLRMVKPAGRSELHSSPTAPSAIRDADATHRRSELRHSEVSVMPELPTSFIEQVIKPISGEFPPNVRVEAKPEATGPPSILISHDEPFYGQTVPFRYQIKFGAAQVMVPTIVSFKQTNLFEMPQDGWTEELIKEAQNAWRRITVADPILHSRFKTEAISFDPYQEEAVNASVKMLDEKGRALVVMATGTGKTLVAFETMKRYLEAKKAKDKDGDPGAVLFVVNNNFILREAEEKLKALYGDQFKASHVYEGEEDFSGDVIFATPSSLISSNRIEDLVKQRKIAAVIFDEVHHVPASQNRLIYRRIQEKNETDHWDTVFLGFTATETRPDRVSVISFFGHEIAYEYPIARGWHEGYLAPMEYISGDADINPHNISPILEGTDFYNEYHAKKYNPDRFGYLYAQYLEHSKELLVKRVLALAPTVKKAEELAAFFRQQGVEAITLTSQDRIEDREWFDHSYYAWRMGRWPEGSPYADQRIPEIVFAVDIFKEGIDVPAINLLLLWSDTNSTIQFIQSIGRGLRVSPFKTHLKIVDTVGLFRKVHLLRYMGALIAQTSMPSDEKLKHEPRKERDLLQEMLAHEVSEDIARRAAMVGVSTERNVSKTIQNYFENLPALLADRYGSYPVIPIKDLMRLDQYLAKQAGFSSVPELENYLSGLSVELINGVSAERIKEFRDRVRPAFWKPMFADDPAPPEFELQDQSYIVFFRIYDLITRTNNQVADDAIYQLFPEFNPRRKEIIKNRQNNLKTLRSYVFGLSPLEMTRKLAEDLQEKSKKSLSKEAHLGLADAATDYLHKQEWFALIFAEGKYMSRHMSEDELAETELMGARYNVQSSSYYQPIVIATYLALSEIEEKLQLHDFDIPNPDFQALLMRQGLLASDAGKQAFMRVFSGKVSRYLEAIEAGDENVRRSTGDDLVKALNPESHKEFLESQEINSEKLKTWFQKFNDITAAQEKLGDKITELDREIAKKIEELLGVLGLYKEFELTELPGVRLTLKRVTPLEFTLSIDTALPQYEHEGLKNPMFIQVRSDHAGRTFYYLIPGEFQYVDVPVEPKATDRPDAPKTEKQSKLFLNGFEALHMNLDDTAKQVLVDAVLNVMDWMKEHFEGEPVPIIPTNHTGTFFTDMFQKILDTTPWDVLGQMQNVDTGMSKEALHFSYNETRNSRLSFLTPDEIRAIRGDDSMKFRNWRDKLAYVFESIYKYWSILLPRWQILEPKIKAWQPSTPNERLIRLRDSIIDKLSGFFKQDVIGRGKMQGVMEIFKIFDVDHPDIPLTDEEFRYAALYTIVRFDQYFETGKIYRQTFKTIWTLLLKYERLKTYFAERNEPVPAEAKDMIMKFVDKALQDYFQNEEQKNTFTSHFKYDAEAALEAFQAYADREQIPLTVTIDHFNVNVQTDQSPKTQVVFDGTILFGKGTQFKFDGSEDVYEFLEDVSMPLPGIRKENFKLTIKVRNVITGEEEDQPIGKATMNFMRVADPAGQMVLLKDYPVRHPTEPGQVITLLEYLEPKEIEIEIPVQENNRPGKRKKGRRSELRSSSLDDDDTINEKSVAWAVILGRKVPADVIEILEEKFLGIFGLSQQDFKALLTGSRDLARNPGADKPAAGISNEFAEMKAKVIQRYDEGIFDALVAKVGPALKHVTDDEIESVVKASQLPKVAQPKEGEFAADDSTQVNIRSSASTASPEEIAELSRGVAKREYEKLVKSLKAGQVLGAHALPGGVIKKLPKRVRSLWLHKSYGDVYDIYAPWGKNVLSSSDIFEISDRDFQAFPAGVGYVELRDRLYGEGAAAFRITSFLNGKLDEDKIIYLENGEQKEINLYDKDQALAQKQLQAGIPALSEIVKNDPSIPQHVVKASEDIEHAMNMIGVITTSDGGRVNIKQASGKDFEFLRNVFHAFLEAESQNPGSLFYVAGIILSKGNLDKAEQFSLISRIVTKLTKKDMLPKIRERYQAYMLPIADAIIFALKMRIEYHRKKAISFSKNIPTESSSFATYKRIGRRISTTLTDESKKTLYDQAAGDLIFQETLQELGFDPDRPIALSEKDKKENEEDDDPEESRSELRIQDLTPDNLRFAAEVKQRLAKLSAIEDIDIQTFLVAAAKLADPEKVHKLSTQEEALIATYNRAGPDPSLAMLGQGPLGLSSPNARRMYELVKELIQKKLLKQFVDEIIAERHPAVESQQAPPAATPAAKETVPAKPVAEPTAPQNDAKEKIALLLAHVVKLREARLDDFFSAVEELADGESAEPDLTEDEQEAVRRFNAWYEATKKEKDVIALHSKLVMIIAKLLSVMDHAQKSQYISEILEKRRALIQKSREPKPEAKPKQVAETPVKTEAAPAPLMTKPEPSAKAQTNATGIVSTTVQTPKKESYGFGPDADQVAEKLNALRTNKTQDFTFVELALKIRGSFTDMRLLTILDYLSSHRNRPVIKMKKKKGDTIWRIPTSSGEGKSVDTTDKTMDKKPAPTSSSGILAKIKGLIRRSELRIAFSDVFRPELLRKEFGSQDSIRDGLEQIMSEPETYKELLEIKTGELIQRTMDKMPVIFEKIGDQIDSLTGERVIEIEFNVIATNVQTESGAIEVRTKPNSRLFEGLNAGIVPEIQIRFNTAMANGIHEVNVHRGEMDKIFVSQVPHSATGLERVGPIAGHDLIFGEDGSPLLAEYFIERFGILAAVVSSKAEEDFLDPIRAELRNGQELIVARSFEEARSELRKRGFANQLLLVSESDYVSDLAKSQAYQMKVFSRSEMRRLLSVVESAAIQIRSELRTAVSA